MQEKGIVLEKSCGIKSEDKRVIPYLNLLNVGACISVIALHCSTAYHSYHPTRVWMLALFVQTVAHWCVPVFFMCTGATLMGYREKYSTKIFFKKRLLRTFIPFLVWSLIFLVYRLFRHTIEIHSLYDIINALTSNGIQPIYWYFYTLFGVYLSMPALSLMAKKENEKVLWYLVIVFISVQSIIPMILRATGLILDSHFQVPIVGGMVGYVILGWLLHHCEPSKTVRRMLYIGAIIGMAIMYVGTYWLNRHNAPEDTIDSLFISYTSVFNVLVSSAVFLFAKNLSLSFLQKDGVKKAIAIISQASFGVYLLHMLIIDEINYQMQWGTWNWKYMLFGTIGFYLIALFIVVIIQRIPVLQKLFP